MTGVLVRLGDCKSQSTNQPIVDECSICLHDAGRLHGDCEYSLALEIDGRFYVTKTFP